jgi:hypothetical protein
MGSVLAAGVAQVWRFVASSADGSRLVVMDTFGRTYVSGDAGASWALVNAPALPWTALALSADGSTLVAAFDGGNLCLTITNQLAACIDDYALRQQRSYFLAYERDRIRAATEFSPRKPQLGRGNQPG